MAKDTLFVAQCWAMAGPTMKRMMPRARGRADRILKRTAHIRIILDEKEMPKPSTKKGVNMTKTSKTTAKAKEVPSTTAERPLTEKPNAKKPLGEKKIQTKKPTGTGAKPKTAPAGKEVK